MADTNKLDDFDLDLDLDEDLLDAGDTGGLFGDEDAIPKRKVTEIVKKRLTKERDRQRKLNESVDKFQKVYGMSLDDAVAFALREQQAAQQTQAQPTGVAGGVQLDPVTQKVMEIDNWRRDFEERQQREREALEFVQRYPNTKFEDIPKEVLDRRARGGVTLAEAYRLYAADNETKEAAKKAADAAARNFQSRGTTRVEGVDYGGGGADGDASTMDEEERQFARMYDMTPKEYLTYKHKAKKYTEEE